MAALNLLQSKLGQTPIGFIPNDDTFNAIHDGYIAILNLISQLNNASPVMMSPNGHFWVATISNVGAVTWTDVGTTRP